MLLFAQMRFFCTEISLRGRVNCEKIWKKKQKKKKMQVHVSKFMCHTKVRILMIIEEFAPPGERNHLYN